jgi:hypothetical protein
VNVDADDRGAMTAGAPGARSGTSHAEWLASREPEGPPALTACVRDLIESHPEWARLSRVDAFIAASELLLRRVLSGGAVARANAVFLLAADACVTWAFEAAADDPGTIAGRAERATKRIAAIAAEFA